MPTAAPVDEELDPTELADSQEEVEAEDMAVLDAEPAAVDPDADIVAEIDKVAVEEDSPKHKAGMVPREIIDRPLRLEDLFDDDYI